MKTNKDYKIHYKVANTDYGLLTVPKGTRLTHKTACGDDVNYHFVDDTSWIKPYPDGTPQYFLIGDVENYGINVPKEYVNYS